MKTTGIYKISNIINGKMYIGQAIDINRRLKHHMWLLNNNKHFNKHLQSAFNINKDVFKIEIYIECKQEELNDWEIFLIKAHDLTNPEYGYNNSFGGEHGLRGRKFSIEHRNNLSKALKGKIGNKNMQGKHHTEETKLKISKSKIGCSSYWKNKHIPDVIKLKISLTLKNKPWSQARRNAQLLRNTKI